MKDFFSSLFLPNRLFVAGGATVLVFLSALFLPPMYWLGVFMLCVLGGLLVVDAFLLFGGKKGILGSRGLQPRLSLGEPNLIDIVLVSKYSFSVTAEVIDEWPVQLQRRDEVKKCSIARQSNYQYTATITPVQRGEYEFGRLLVYIQSPLGLLQRRFTVASGAVVKVYPAFQHLKKYALQFQATSAYSMPGVRRTRRLGHSLEFEKIKEYVLGDDVRTLNWKATARSNNMMVNTYTDARQQLIYCLIDKGRSMKLSFDGMSLLDYSINASLALLNIALLKQDKAGLITFAKTVHDVLPADRKAGQLHKIIETLYRQQTDGFLEANHDELWKLMRKTITQRSLVMLFTNFETQSSLERQLPFLKQIAKHHLTCVVFFKNTLLDDLQKSQPDDVEGIYVKTIAEQFAFEKRQIVMELRKHGVIAILTTPQELTLDVINKYVELKARQMV
jgi:uncharacterized protein (DUF58 family)